MRMHDFHWSPSEKRIARRAFDAALERELADLLSEFKARAARAVTTEDMWATGRWLDRAQRDIDSKYDYRYSQLLFVFARLLREKRLAEADLSGLAGDKLAAIGRMVAL